MSQENPSSEVPLSPSDNKHDQPKKKIGLMSKIPVMKKTVSVYPHARRSLQTEHHAKETIAVQEKQKLEFDQFKSNLQNDVSTIIDKNGFIHPLKAEKFIKRFFYEIGVEDAYFRDTPAELVSSHIETIYAEQLKRSCGKDFNSGELNDIFIHQDYGDSALFCCRTSSSTLTPHCIPLEREIEAKYFREGMGTEHDNHKHHIKNRPYRLQCFTTTHNFDDEIFTFPLRFYVLKKPKYVQDVDNNNFDEKKEAQKLKEEGLETEIKEEIDLEKISEEEFLQYSKEKTKEIYLELIKKVTLDLYPVVQIVEGYSQSERKILICYRHGSTHSLFSSLTELYHYSGLTTHKKYVEQFSNGISIVCLCVRPLTSNEKQNNAPSAEEFDNCLQLFLHDIGHLFALPRHVVSTMFSNANEDKKEHELLRLDELNFIHCAWQFAHQFLSRYSTEYQALLKSVQKHDPTALGYLLRLKQNLRKDTFNESRIMAALSPHSKLIRKLYDEFRNRHHPKIAKGTRELPDLSWLESLIRKETQNEIDYQIFMSMVNFVKHIIRTNFFKKEKLAISFRLHSGFLDKNEFPLTPYGVYFVVGAEFRGFHVRFTDIARGGIRLIVSRDRSSYDQNVGTVFVENYNLASTQHRKNKDLPEGGSKGTILMNFGRQSHTIEAFRKYIDALLDLMVVDNNFIVDHLGTDEILFLGPDEGTADLMDWACKRARRRKYKFWKSISTGKQPNLGGIPHDVYGMTTRGIHQFVLGIFEKLNLKEEDQIKCQTGGPDGDLGSNEILISKDKTIAIVDGSGILYDPQGLNREELNKCAKKRLMIDSFDISKLSKNGYRVLCNEKNIKLNNGEHIESGLQYRNDFHLHNAFCGDLFVPCGGRPEAVNLNNLSRLFNEKTGKCKFKYIVEGANLFFTQEARLELEKEGVIVFKDASANKGGVTSSSLEVLAALSMTDEQFLKHMCCDNNIIPKFYQKYVEQVCQIIERNARLEFNCIWNEYERTNTPKSIISDLLSNKINDLNNQLIQSILYQNIKLRNRIILDAVPTCLIELIGEQQFFQHVPENYLRAIFGAHLAAEFVYLYGLQTSEFSFIEFLQKFGLNLLL